MHLTYVLWHVWFTIIHDIKKKSIDYFYQAEYFEQFLFWKKLYYFIQNKQKCGNFDKISYSQLIVNR